MVQTTDGFLVLFKRQRNPQEGAEVYVPAGAVVAVEPHRSGSFVYVAGHRWDVGHAHTEIIEAVNVATGHRR